MVWSKFHEKKQAERIEILKEQVGLTEIEVSCLSDGLCTDEAELMTENVVGRFSLPLSMATNFLIDGKSVVIPMVSEEPSVVAGASKAAKIIAKSGGFTTVMDESLSVGQIQIMLKDGEGGKVEKYLEENKEDLVCVGNMVVPNLVKRGGGVREIAWRRIQSRVGEMLIVEIKVDTKEAMGANLVNSICEELGKKFEDELRVEVILKILSNLADKRLVSARCVIKVGDEISKEIAERIISAQAMAEVDVYRATTHNKGIFNGIDAVAIATGQDFRAIEAGGHAYAAKSGRYLPLTRWVIESENLIGEIRLPMVVGIVGGISKAHRGVQVNLKILGVKQSSELARVMAAVGLAQNFAALHALVGEGIQKGHMRLHVRKGGDGGSRTHVQKGS